jgi:MFS family permease
MSDIKDPNLHESAFVPVDQQQQDGAEHLDKRLNTHEAPINSTVFIEDKYPRYKYVILIGAFLALFMGFGFIGAWGVYQEHFLNVVWKGVITPAQISFIASLMVTISFAISLFAGPIIRRWGERLVFGFGALVFPLGVLTSSFVDTPWLLFLTLGVIAGMGIGSMIIANWYYLAKYWDRRRGFAMGFASAGSGFGGLAAAPIIRAMIEGLDWRWSLRIYAFVAWGVLLVVTVLMKPFDPPKGKFNFHKGADGEAVEQRGFWASLAASFTLLKDKRLLWACIGTMLLTFTYRIPYFYVPSYTVNLGLTASNGALALGLMNGFSAGARIVFGTASDYLGATNGIIVTSMISLIAVFFVWIFAKSYAVVLLFSILYGSGSGGDAGLIVLVIRSLSTIEQFPDAIALSYIAQIPGNLAGPSIFGALIGIPKSDGTKGPNYFPAQLFAGCVWVLIVASFVYLRFITSRKILARV